MTKRPKGIYFVAFWFFYSFLFQVRPLTQLMSSSQGHGVPAIIQIIWAVSIFFLIFELVGLIQLRPLQRWLYVILISLNSLSMIYNLTSMGFLHKLSWRVVLMVCFFLTINGITIWYMIRPSFHQRCIQFRAECDKDAVEKYVTKKLGNRI